jgi:hypothetical protein
MNKPWSELAVKVLFLSAPKDKNTATTLHRTFSSILINHVGPEYAIYGNLVGQIIPGMKVVLFERIGRRQAEGVVASLNPSGNKTAQGISRYNVVIRNLHEVHYTNPPHVNRCGVAIV